MINKQKKQSTRLYQSIEVLPVWNWEEIKKTGDLRYLIIEGEGEGLEDLWLRLQDEFNERVGMSETGNHFHDKFMEAQELRLQELIYSCDEYHPKLSRTKIERGLLEKELKDMPVIRQTLEDQAIQLEIFFTTEPGAFNPKTTSVLIWYKYLNEHERRIKELQRSQKNTA